MNRRKLALLVLLSAAAPAAAQLQRADRRIGWTEDGDVMVDPFWFSREEEHAEIPREEISPYPIPHPFAYRGDERAHRHAFEHKHWHTHRLADGTLIHHKMPHNHSYWHYGKDELPRESETRMEEPQP